jgi:hypothetical protein
VCLFSFSGCKKGEEQQRSRVPLRQGPIIEPSTQVSPHESTRQKVKFEVVVPPEVKEQWSSVKLMVEDKKLNKKQEFIVKIGDMLKIPDSRLTVKIGPFLPDFKISPTGIITSVSNDPNNPSVGVIVYENGTQIFPRSGKWGWLYAKFPTIHSFQHERFGLILKEGIKKQRP